MGRLSDDLIGRCRSRSGCFVLMMMRVMEINGTGGEVDFIPKILSCSLLFITDSTASSWLDGNGLYMP